MKKSFFVCVLSLAFIGTGFSQVIPSGNAAPVADGILNASEYPQIDTYQNMRLGRAVSTDGKTLYFALEAPASGWVAVSIGSSRMDGAYLVLGYDNGKIAPVSEETGRGHSHQPNAANILLSKAVKETSGKTVLELSLPSSAYAGSSSLKMIAAYGKKDDFTSIHQKYVPLNVDLKLP